MVEFIIWNLTEDGAHVTPNLHVLWNDVYHLRPILDYPHPLNWHGF